MVLRRFFRRLKPEVRMGMRGKLASGFALLALILFLSSIIAIFEYRHMSNYVSDLIAENINCINTAHKLVNICDDYNLALLAAIGDDDLSRVPQMSEETFTKNYDYLRETFKHRTEIAMTDSVRYAFVAYMLVAGEVDEVWVRDFTEARAWYFDRLQPVYKKLRGYIDSLSEMTYEALRENSVTLQEGFYRSIMPGVIAVAVGILIVILFLYFIVSRYVTPIRKMLRHIQDYERFDKTYTYTFDESDELSTLNNEITDIIEQNLSLKRKINSSREEQA